MSIGTFTDSIKSVVPESIKILLRRLRRQLFVPYVEKKQIEGVDFQFLIADETGRVWYDLHEWIEMRFVRDHMVEPGDVIFECGAHHGCTTVLLSDWVGVQGKVFVFEAVPNNCRIIRKQLKLNRIKNVFVHEKAMGVQKGEIIITDESNASVVFSEQKGIKVDLACLDDYLSLNPTLLKIDVEGFETEVLRGAKKILANRPKLVIEIHTEFLENYSTTVQEILDLIHPDDYHLWIQWSDKSEPVKYDSHAPIRHRVHLFGLPKPGHHSA